MTTSAEALSTLSGDTLKGIAKASGLSRYSALNKGDLVDLLMGAQAKSIELVWPSEDGGDDADTDTVEDAELSPSSDTDTDTDAPNAVIIIKRDKVQVDGYRWIRILPHDVFTGDIARQLWENAPDSVEAYDG